MGAGETLAALETTSKYSLAKGKIDDFFIQWLSLPHTQEEIAALINDAKHDRPLQVASPNPFPRLVRGTVRRLKQNAPAATPGLNLAGPQFAVVASSCAEAKPGAPLGVHLLRS